MAVVALFTWVVTALGGLYLVAIWLIEYDPDFQHAAATRLPVPVVFGHVLFAVAGLVLWVLYLITDRKAYCWATIAVLAVIATLGLTMAVRWLGVYRARTSRASAPAIPVPSAVWPYSPEAQTASQPRAMVPFASPTGQARPGELAVPPERHFPVSVVIAHGIFAVTTIVLVVLTTLSVRGN
jgi:hypothetical protein